MFKKIISVVLLLAACFSFAVSAEGSLQTYIYKNGDIEIQIQHTDFTEEELARVVVGFVDYRHAERLGFCEF